MKMSERMAHHYEGINRGSINEHPFLHPRRLYRTEDLGTLHVKPRSRRAGTRATLELTYRVGPRGVPRGAALRVIAVGFNPMPGFADASSVPGPVKVDVSSTGEAALAAAVVNGFSHREVNITLKRGTLSAGDVVAIRLGADGTLTLSEVARPLRFVLEFKSRPANAHWEVVDEARMEVQPGKPVSATAFSDPLGKTGQATPLLPRVVDRYGNRAARHTAVKWKRTRGVTVTDDGQVSMAEPGVYRLTGVDAPSGLTVVSTPLKRTRRKPAFRLAFGDIHAHDFLSPGLASPREYYENAIAQGLHFVSLPVQSQGENLTEDRWIIANYMAEEYNDPGTFVAIPGFEWQHYAFGHKNVYFEKPDQPLLSPYDRRYNTVPKLFRALRGSDALVAAHHAGYKLDVHVPGTDWHYADESLQPVAEICSCHGSSERPQSERPLNAPGKGTFMQDAWAAGHHVGVIGGSDSHSGLPVNSPREPRKYPGGLACVYTRDLTRRGILEALRSRRCYATTGARMIVEFDINGHAMGSLIAPNASRRKVRAFVAGTAPVRELVLLKNNRPVHTLSPGREDAELVWTDPDGPERAEDWYYIRAIQNDGEIAWSSPVWVKGGER